MASTKIYRTFGTPTNLDRWTWSAWIKRGALGVIGYIFEGSSSSAFTAIKFETDNTLLFGNYNGGYLGRLITNRKFTDIAAWLHIVAVWDSDNATAGDRMKLYVNGVEETSFSTDTNPSSGEACQMSSGNDCLLGVHQLIHDYWNGGILSHVQFVDGLALAPTEFGETDATSGIWKIKTSPTVTYGTNGFFLKMEDRTNLDLDSSSNGHTFTTAGTLTATYDNPSNNFSTLNPLNMPTSAKPTFSQGNNTVVSQSAAGKNFGGTSTLGMVSGKWYTEFKPVSVSNGSIIGITGEAGEDARQNFGVGESEDGYGYVHNGNKRNNNSETSYGNTYTDGNIIGVALDLDNLKIYYSKNGVWETSGDPTSGATGTGAAFTVTAVNLTDEGHYAFFCSDYATGTTTFNANFGNGYFATTAITSAGTNASGNGDFEYDVPTGYTALSTKGLDT